MPYLSSEQQEDAHRIWKILEDIRTEMKSYFDYRQINLSNHQLFSFMMSAPLSMAIALDSMLDAREEHVLDYYSSQTHNNMLSQFSNETYTILEMVPEKRGVNTKDEEMGKVIREEALFMLDQSRKWKDVWVNGLKVFLKLEDILAKYNPQLKPLRDSLVEGMIIIVKTNLGSDVLEERKMKEILDALDITLDEEKIQKIIASLKP